MPFRTGITALLVICALPAADKPLTQEQRRLNIESFEHVWTTVRDRHWDPKLNGVDWQAVHDELRPRIEKARTMEQARAVLSDMLARLKETHFAIVPSDLYDDLGPDDDTGGADKPLHEGSPGLALRVIGGHALVTRVDADSPAARAGVKPGWEVLRVDGKALGPRLERIRAENASSTLLDLMLARSALAPLTGDVGTTMKVAFDSGGGHIRELAIERRRPRGVEARLGNLPPLYFWVESRKVEPDIGLVSFNLFFQPEELIQSVQKMVDECAGCSGMVIDLRGNPGGLGALAMGLAGWFVDQGGRQLGAMHMRDTTLKFVVFARPNPFRGPLAILVDGCSASTSEIFAQGMKDMGRARIFGARTAGAALPSVFERLPNGDGFQYAIANYISLGGKPLEGNGVTPDEEVKVTQQALLAGQDPVLEAAVAWIHRQKN